MPGDNWVLFIQVERRLQITLLHLHTNLGYKVVTGKSKLNAWATEVMKKRRENLRAKHVALYFALIFLFYFLLPAKMSL